MQDDSAQVDEFMAELYDKFYPQVMKGVEMMDLGDVNGGIEILARPLHTIKGVTGFMPGFEEASRFTHKVESYLKKLQSAAIEADQDNVAAAVRAVSMVFQVIEQIKDMGAPDEVETTEILQMLEAKTAPKDSGPAAEAGITVEKRQGVTLIRVGVSRVHLAAQREPILAALKNLEPGGQALLDLEQVVTFNSASWEAVEEYADTLHLAVAGLGPACKDVFYFWGFDRSMTVYPTADDFWTKHTSQ